LEELCFFAYYGIKEIRVAPSEDLLKEELLKDVKDRVEDLVDSLGVK
jgi:hypothetical protein